MWVASPCWDPSHPQQDQGPPSSRGSPWPVSEVSSQSIHAGAPAVREAHGSQACCGPCPAQRGGQLLRPVRARFSQATVTVHLLNPYTCRKRTPPVPPAPCPSAHCTATPPTRAVKPTATLTGSSRSWGPDGGGGTLITSPEDLNAAPAPLPSGLGLLSPSPHPYCRPWTPLP